jgi:hypothetical protein
VAQYSLAAALCAAAVWLARRYVDLRGADTDFFPRWYALRALLWEGRDPYGSAVTAEIVARTAAAAAPDVVRSTYGLTYPLPGALLLAPLTALPYEWAAAVWLVVGIVGLAAAGALVAAPTAGQLSLAGVAAVLVCVPALWNVALVQPGMVVPLLVAVALVTRSRRPTVSGAALAVASLLKPQLVALLILAWSGREGFAVLRGDRGARRFLSGALGAAALPAIAATFLLPSWPASALAAARTYAAAGVMRTAQPALYVLLSQFAPAPVAVGLTVVLAVPVIVWALRGWRIVVWSGFMRSIVAGALLTPPAWETSAFVHMLPVAHATGAARRPWRLVAWLAVVSAVLAPLSLLWPWRAGAVDALVYAALAVLAAPRLAGWGLRPPSWDRFAVAAGAAAQPDPVAPAPR